MDISSFSTPSDAIHFSNDENLTKISNTKKKNMKIIAIAVGILSALIITVIVIVIIVLYFIKRKPIQVENDIDEIGDESFI